MKSDAELQELNGLKKMIKELQNRSFIRKMRLDETPQLINVIAGQMSLIGS